MRLLQLYIGRSVAFGFFSVMGVLLTLFFLMDFINELDSVGQHQYTLFHATAYSLLNAPLRLYQVFPLATLLGTMLGLGALSRNSELVIIRSSGISLLRLVSAIIKVALLLIFIAMLIGEVIAPPVQQYANLKRIKFLSKEISLNTEYGLWARDGKTFIHVRRVTNTGQLQDVTLYQFADNQQLDKTIRAKTADYIDKQWRLNNVSISHQENGRVSQAQKPFMLWGSLLDPELVSVVTVKPEMLPLWKLYSYIDYLKVNGLDADQYELAFWGKVIMPLTILAMVMIAIPFVFVSQRHTPIGKQILIGFMVGISFFILSKLSGQMGVVYQLHPLLVVILPTMIVMAIGLWMLRRVR